MTESIVLLEVIVDKQVQKFHILYGTRSFIAVITRAHHIEPTLIHFNPVHISLISTSISMKYKICIAILNIIFVMLIYISHNFYWR
jgi:hypothetical protein